MRIAILGRNKLGFINGTCKRENYGTNLVDLWERCNAIVLSWLMNYVSLELLSEMVYSSNANEVWDDLKERFDKVDCSRIFQIHREIATSRQDTKFDSLAPIAGRDAANSREFVQFMERQKLLQFLMGLNESYEQARSQLLMMIPVPSVNKAYSMLMKRESQRTMSNTFTTVDGGEMAALMTNRSRNQQRPKKNYNLQCDVCHMKGHTKETCYRVVGYPKDNKFRKKYNSQTTANFAAEDVPATLVWRKLTTPTVHTTTMPTSISVSQDTIKLETWHQRLGHLPMEKLKRIDKFKNLHTSNRSSDCAMCPVCPLARQTRLPFPISTSRAKAPFDLLHANVWGPFRVPTYDSKRFFLTVVDDFSRINWLFLMNAKDETCWLMKRLFSMISTQFDCSVKILRTDNGSEFVNSNMKQLVETLGIVHQTTCVYTPQQNGIVERRHRYILETARALRFQYAAPLRFWENPPTSTNDFALDDADSLLTPEALLDSLAPQDVEPPSHVEVVQPIAVRKSQRTTGPPRWM
ncbi:PREDICTED: uncharacterized protein LOC109210292 [Nicotiana attenuata]|uniref:uncharacterized protein LOC109210292 n=1 Tax=Nicotiana attenuata TaxID=49451 RepID=UPI0009047F1B|nr:PREDICTED: uncharacterized protein LOC109210292 [Nicotiana attenuata]